MTGGWDDIRLNVPDPYEAELMLKERRNQPTHQEDGHRSFSRRQTVIALLILAAVIAVIAITARSLSG